MREIKEKAMASQRHKNDRQQKLILAIAAVVLIIIVVGITALTTYVKKYSPSKEQSDYKSYYNLSGDDSIFVTFNETQM